MASHLYKVGHVTHNWQQMAFLQEIFNKEDALRAEVDHYGNTRAKRSTMLDWDELSQASGRSSNRSTGRRSTARSHATERLSASGDSQCGPGNETYRSSCTSRSTSSSCFSDTSRSSWSSSSSSSSGSRSSRRIDTGRSSSSRLSGITSRSIMTNRSDTSIVIQSLRKRKEKLQSRLNRLEQELASIDEKAIDTERSTSSKSKDKPV